MNAPDQRKTAAEQALIKADCASLSRLHKEAEKDLQVMIEGLAVFASKKGEPRHSDDAIQAMRDVAIAAIELAKTVAEKNAEETE